MKLLVARRAPKATSVVTSAALAPSAVLVLKATSAVRTVVLALSAVLVPKATSAVITVVLAPSAVLVLKVTSVVMTAALALSAVLVAMIVRLILSVAGFKSSPSSFLCKRRAHSGARSSVSLLMFGAYPAEQSTRQHHVHPKATVAEKIIVATTVAIIAVDVTVKVKAVAVVKAVAAVAVVTVKARFPCLRSRASSEAGPCGATFVQQALKTPACPYLLPVCSLAKR